jgi:hypothetical protein
VIHSIVLGWKGLTETKTQRRVLKRFAMTIADSCNKLECLSLAGLSARSNAGNSVAYLSEAHFRCSFLGWALGLPTNNRLGWKGLP